MAFVFRIVSIRSRIKLALCLSWPNIIPNGSRCGRIQNRDYQIGSQNFLNEIAVESHLSILVIDSVKRPRQSLLCFINLLLVPRAPTDGQTKSRIWKNTIFESE